MIRKIRFSDVRLQNHIFSFICSNCTKLALIFSHLHPKNRKVLPCRPLLSHGIMNKIY
jgi:hypothetical protein